ncbi:hypothetical protein GCM10008994_10410 [Halorubrum ejinorense]|uniref:DUF8116 domain-containing protein n=2 Tax=Halorubrum ejinorense TaxID=425309 RepID=A0AAV3SRB1_9EURY
MRRVACRPLQNGYFDSTPPSGITVLRLLRLTTPADFAAWYAAGRAYTTEVAEGMGFSGVDALDDDRTVERLRTAPDELTPAAARSVAATLLADGAFSEPYCEWLPTWYELALIAPVRYADRQLRKVAGRVAAGASVTATAPRFSRPADVFIDGEPALSRVSGFRGRFLLADSLLHLEWFDHVAAADEIDVPADLVARTREESLSYYGGDRDRLSPEVRRFQRHLFADDAWVRRVDDAYDLDSRLFGLWERLLRDERRRLEDA